MTATAGADGGVGDNRPAMSASCPATPSAVSSSAVPGSAVSGSADPSSADPRTATPSAAAPSAGRDDGRLIANIVAQLALGLLAMTICLPSMQEWPAIFGASQAGVQATFAGYVASYGLLQLVYGAVSDRIGRKPVLLVGLILAFTGSVAAALAPSLPVLIAARVLQGAGCAAGMVIGRALVQDLFNGPDRTRVMAFIGMMMGVCPPLAMLIGGQFHVALGWQSNFWLIAALSAVLFVAALKGLPGSAWPRPPAATASGAAGASERPGFVGGYARLAREPVFVLFVIVLGLTSASFYSFLGGAPLVLANYGVGPKAVGLYVMAPPIAYIFGNLLTARLLKAGHGDRQLMIAGQAFALSGPLIVIGLSLSGINDPLALALPMLTMGIGHGLMLPPTLTGTVGIVPTLAGSAAAVAGLVQQVVGALGGFLVGLVPHQGPVNLALMIFSWSAAGALALLVVLTRRSNGIRDGRRRQRQ